MNSDQHRPGAEHERATPHTEEHATADEETGDTDPEAEQQAARVRRNLEGAEDTVNEERRQGRESQKGRHDD